VKPATKIVLAILRPAVAAALLGYLVFSGAIQWSELRGLARNWPATAAAFALLVVCMTVTAARLCVLLRAADMTLSLGSSIRLTLITAFFSACLPGSAGGELVRIYYATENNRGRRTEVITILMLDRAMGMFGMVLLPLLFAPVFWPLVRSSSVLVALLWGAAALATAMAAAFIIGSSPRLAQSRPVAWACRTLPLGQHAARVFQTIAAARRFTGSLLSAMALALLAQVLAIAAMLVVAHAVRPDGFAWPMLLLIPLAFLANTLPLTPGGLGVGEVALNQLFALVGLAGGAETLLGWRLLSITLSLGGLVFYLRGRRNFIQGSAQLAAPQYEHHREPQSRAPQHVEKQPVLVQSGGLS
jgi:uncharacterized protein (TIRG00374 family)